MTTMNEVVAFLLGEGELDGVWFGEKHERKRGSFWWREYLREAYDAHLAREVRVPDAMDAELSSHDPQSHDEWAEYGYARGWNACREAMLSQRGEVEG